MAPLAITFDTIGTTADGLQSFREILYSWNFADDSESAKWAQGTKAGTASKNKAYGPIAAHVFEKAGTFNVKVTAFHDKDGAPVTKTIAVQVSEPDQIFKNNTVCVSNTNLPVAGLDGCPAGAYVQTVTSLADLSGLTNTYKRILLKRGEIWNTNASTLQITSSGPGIVAAYGTGAKPRIQLNSNDQAVRIASTASDWRLIEIDMSAPGFIGSYQRGVSVKAAKNILVLRSDIGPLWMGVAIDDGQGVYVVDSSIHDMWPKELGGSMVGIWAINTDSIAILGTRISRVGGEHGARLQGVSKAVISNSHFENTVGNVITVRGKANSTAGNLGVWTGTWTENVVVSDNIIDGGENVNSYSVMHAGPMNSATAERLQNILVERNLIISNKTVAVELSVESNATLRNNILVTLNNNTAIYVGGGNELTPSPRSTYIHDNNIYKPYSSLNERWTSVMLTGKTGYYATGVDLRNNLTYAPGHTRDATGAGKEGTFFKAPTYVPETAYFLGTNSTNLQLNNVDVWDSDNPTLQLKQYIPKGYALESGGRSQGTRNFLDYNGLLRYYDHDNDPLTAMKETVSVRGALNP